MKTAILLLCLMISGTFALDLKSELNKVAPNQSDSIILIHITTNWRAHLNYKSYNLNRFEDSSDMIWVFNVSTGKGILFDETPAITSFFDILNFRINKVYNRVDKEEQLLITGLLKSDAGNYYGVVINDNQTQLTFSGPASSDEVIREYDVQTSFVGTYRELLIKLDR